MGVGSATVKLGIAAACLWFLVPGCFVGQPRGGALGCSNDPARPCPPGFECAIDHKCWRSGHLPPPPQAPPAPPPLDLGGADPPDLSAVVDMSPIDMIPPTP
jgi:hypothetical protein